MSCPPQQRLSIYVDGELALGEARTLESHLVQCRRCRATVLALRDEVSVLTDVLHGRALAPVRIVEPRARARGLVIGLVPTLGLAALAGTVLTGLLEIGLPAGTSWLVPIGWMGAYEMVFDTIFVLRDRAPVLVEGAIAIGALFGVAGVLTFLVGTLGKRLVDLGAVLLAVLGATSIAATPARAFDLRKGEERVVIAAGETVAETLIVSARSLRIDGRVEGNLVVMAESIRIEGEVDGNVVAVGEEVEILGTVDGTLYVAAELVRIEGGIDDELYGFTEDLTLEEAGRVERDVALFAERVRVDGKVGRDLFLMGDRIEVQGEIGRHLVVRADEATLRDGARIAGDLRSYMTEDQQPHVADGARIGGERIEEIVEHRHPDRSQRWTDGHFYLRQIALIVSAFLVGMLLHVVRPGVFESALPTAGDFFRELGLGFVTLVVAPIAILICFVTVIGIPIGLIATFAFVTGVFVSLILVAALVGSALLGEQTDKAGAFGRTLLLGLVVVAVAVNVPFVGGVLWIVGLLTGVGMLLRHVVESWRLRAG